MGAKSLKRYVKVTCSLTDTRRMRFLQTWDPQFAQFRQHQSESKALPFQLDGHNCTLQRLWKFHGSGQNHDNNERPHRHLVWSILDCNTKTRNLSKYRFLEILLNSTPFVLLKQARIFAWLEKISSWSRVYRALPSFYSSFYYIKSFLI